MRKKKRPVAKGNGLTQAFVSFWCHKVGRQAALQAFDRFNGDAFLDFLKMIRHKFPRCHIFMDKAVSPHHRSRKVRDYFDNHKDALIYFVKMPSNCVTRVYGDGVGVEHSQARPY